MTTSFNKLGRVIGKTGVVVAASAATGVMAVSAGIVSALGVNRLTGFAVNPRPWKEILLVCGYMAGVAVGGGVGVQGLLVPAFESLIEELKEK